MKLKPITLAEASAAERMKGKAFMLEPMSKRDMEAWNRRMENRRHIGAVTVWRSRPFYRPGHGPPAAPMFGPCWIRSLPRNGKWVLTYSQVPPRPGERLLPCPDIG